MWTEPHASPTLSFFYVLHTVYTVHTFKERESEMIRKNSRAYARKYIVQQTFDIQYIEHVKKCCKKTAGARKTHFETTL